MVRIDVIKVSIRFIEGFMSRTSGVRDKDNRIALVMENSNLFYHFASLFELAMKTIQGAVTWGIIGCGDVCEVKSGPAFNKVPNSRLAAVMRRDLAKAKDY